jgi:molybdopterin-synthase adenylyltransferase
LEALKAGTMIELVIAAGDLDDLRTKLLGHTHEQCAVLVASQTRRADGTVRLLVRELQYPAAEDYTRQDPFEAELRPELVARVTKRARREGYSLIFAHTHPGDEPPEFSPVDDAGESHLSAFLSNRHPNYIHGALVLSAGGTRARRLGSGEGIRVISVGKSRCVAWDPSVTDTWDDQSYDRQVRAFGSAGQRALQRLRVAIVGLGGTGSIVAQQLAHLGVRDFILIDPDVVERTNLNRVSGATLADLGMQKIQVAARYIHALSPEANVTQVPGDVMRVRFAQELLNSDCILGCTDSHGSRAVMQQVAYQYLIPYIDLGTTITVSAGLVTHIYGRVQLLAPGLACFACDGLLNANEVRRDMMTAFERQADPYLAGAREPAPAVMSINGTVASLAVTMFLSMVTGIPVPARHLLYNAKESRLRNIRATPLATCYICSRTGAYARGDAWPLQARQD